MSGARELKAVSETARERETFKYNPYVLTDCRINQTGKPFPSSELSTATDSILTSLAQLGTYRTSTQKALISLFDSKYQYVVAEASPSTPLTPGFSSDECPEPLLHCGTAIPRDHGLCEHVLFLDSSSEVDKHRTADGMYCTAVTDLTADPRFSSRPLCPYVKSCRFYAAVPIRTPKGIDIGAYCVLNPIQPDNWNDQCFAQMQDISRAIMDHLEAKRSTHAYRRNERVTRGMGSFIEGKATLSGWQSGPNVEAFADNRRFEGALNAKQQRLELQDHTLEEHEIDTSPFGLDAQPIMPSGSWSATLPERHASDATPLRSPRSHLASDSSSKPIAQGKSSMEDSGHEGLQFVFSKAANLIRESFEVAGCFFFDVTVGSYRASTVPSPHGEQQDAERGNSNQSSTGSSDENLPTPSSEMSDSACDLLGFSTSDTSSINEARVTENEKFITRRFLARLLRRYPDGKIFNFNPTGELQSSDSSSDDAAIEVPINHLEVTQKAEATLESATATAQRRQHGKQLDALKELGLIHQAFPSARSVAFVPVWDAKRERWFAGGFVYTSTPTRVFTLRGELSFFTAFSKLVAAKVQTLETLQANKAKSDVLGSVSHELRSPLHGVILGAELLNDTQLSVFQANATHTIETCCRTLLDTIDHLLEYSKVNTYGAQRRREAMATSPKLRKKQRPVHFSNKTLHSNAMLDSLVEEVADSMCAGFVFQHMSVGQLSKQTKSQSTDTAGHNRLDSKQAIDQLSLDSRQESEAGTRFSNVLVDLSLDPSCDWAFYTQAGAIRRLVMNLLGNSLKYTAKGSIKVSLTQDSSSSKQLKSGARMVKLVVQDTGQGIGEDYLRHKLYRPFCQEDELASGTGLGLSLVKSIVSQLRGKIQVDSKIGVGTMFTVTLPLEMSQKHAAASRNVPDDVKDFEDQLKSISGLRIRLEGFKSAASAAASWDRRAIIEEICRHWLHLEIVTDDPTQPMAPDIVLWSDDAIPGSFGRGEYLAKTPNVVVCQNALESYQRHSTCEAMGQEGTFEFITQPVGPRKLAKSIQLAHKRWTGLAKAYPPPHALVADQPRHATESTASKPGGLHSENAESSSDLHIQPSRSEQTIDRPPAQPVDTAKSDTNSGAVKMLLVDDNKINLKMLVAYMGKLGKQYETATTGKEALEKYVESPHEFAGILMDVSMPVMDGLEATRRIRTYASQHDIGAVTIIALTGLASASAQQEARESGVDIFLTKPVKFKALSEVLKSVNILSQQGDSGTGT